MNRKSGDLLVQHETKSGKTRLVPVPADILAELRNRVGKIIRYLYQSGSSIRRDIRRKSSIKGFRLHRLRHTLACQWIENGGGLVGLQQILGHASVETTQRYARLSDEVVRRKAHKVHSVTASNMASSSAGAAVSPYALVAQVDRATVS